MNKREEWMKDKNERKGIKDKNKWKNEEKRKQERWN